MTRRDIGLVTVRSFKIETKIDWVSDTNHISNRYRSEKQEKCLVQHKNLHLLTFLQLNLWRDLRKHLCSSLCLRECERYILIALFFYLKNVLNICGTNNDNYILL